MNRVKTPVTNIIVKIPIVIVAILIFIRDYNELVDYFKLSGNSDSTIDYLKIIFTTPSFRNSLIMLIPLIGVFLKTKIGWLLMLSFYFLWVILFIYGIIGAELERDGAIIIVFIIMILPIVFIGVMNNTDNTVLTYKLKRKELLKLNLAAFTVALIELAIISFFNLTQS